MQNSARTGRLSDRGKGILMSLVGVFVLSPDSLLIRLAGLDDYTLIFYRGLFPVFSISLALWLYYRADFLPAPGSLCTTGRERSPAGARRRSL